MSLYILIIFTSCVCFILCQGVLEEIPNKKDLVECQTKISESILAILEHFKQPDPLGLPGAEIPEPYPVPDMQQTHTVATIYFTNTAVYGLSKFRILYINAEMDAMEVQAAMSIDQIQAHGNYNISSWFGFSQPQGPFTVDVTGLIVHARAALGVERDGKLRAQRIAIDMSFSAIAVNFENLGTFGNLIQGLINRIGTFLFNSIKPYIFKEAYTKIRAKINAKLEDFMGDNPFANSISPFDMVVSVVRRIVRGMGMDPFKVNNYKTSVSLFTVSLENTWITGMSSFQRVGNITLKIENSTAIADIEIGTQMLEGRTQWDATAMHGLMSKVGTASFSVDHIIGRIVLVQPLDTRKKMDLRDLTLEVGNIQVRCDGAGTLDYAIEFLVNIAPNLLRRQIMDAIEGLLKKRIQQELNSFNVEELIESKVLPAANAMQERGFKLSSLRDTDVVEKPFDEDDFFNF